MRAWVYWGFVAATGMFGGCALSPVPLAPELIADVARANADTLDIDQEVIARPIDLHEAMARALKYNLEYRLESAQTSLRVAELDLAHYNLLPNAVANAGYAARDNKLASSSFNLVNNTPNFGASTSQDQRLRTGDLTFSWNILDFGLSYVRARQAADKVLISEEMQRKVVHRLLEDVRTAFWRAAAYERLVARMRRLEARSNVAIAMSRRLANARETSPVVALTSERELVEIKRTTKELQRELAVAKSQLAALMNVKPGVNFQLDTRSGPAVRSSLPMSEEQLIDTALQFRPELRENLYQQRINRHEAHAALIELLPGVQLFAGPLADSNSFLLHHDWVAWGAKASWNLLKVFQYPARRTMIEHQDEVLRARALAVTMAVMTQVQVSRIRFEHLRTEVAVAHELRSVQARLVQQMRGESAAGRISELVLLREEMALSSPALDTIWHSPISRVPTRT